MSGLGLSALVSIAVLCFALCSMFIFAIRRPYILQMALRSLKGHKKMNAALLCAACVSTTVISGSLIAGDSLRESISEAVYENLGEVDEIVTSSGLFNASIIERLRNDQGLMSSIDEIAPLIHLQGLAENPDTSATTKSVNIMGIDEGFLNFGKLISSD